jgi:hypothetical protein
LACPAPSTAGIQGIVHKRFCRVKTGQISDFKVVFEAIRRLMQPPVEKPRVLVGGEAEGAQGRRDGRTRG